jgi:hypothetical protein
MDVVGNLVQLVEANSSSHSSGFSSGAATAPKASKNHGLKKSDHTFHNIASGQTQQQQTACPAPKQTARTSAPEKVIPLKGDENTGTDDFKEFNG